MRFALEGNAGAQAPHPLECGLCAYQAVTRTNFSPGAVRPCSIQFTRCSCGWTAAGQRRNPDITGALRPMAQSPAYTTRSGLRRATVLQATKSYRGFESDALRQRVCTWGVVPACVARKAPQWGLSFVERPPENGPSVPERANSPNFLWGVIGEWSFVRQDDQMSMDEPRDYFQWKSEQPLRVRILTGGAMNHVHFRGVKRTCCDHPSMSALTQSGHGGLAETSPARLDFRGLCGTVLQTMHLVPPVGGSAIGA